MIEVCVRPLFSVGGTRSQRCGPLSFLNSFFTPLPVSQIEANPSRLTTL